MDQAMREKGRGSLCVGQTSTPFPMFSLEDCFPVVRCSSRNPGPRSDARWMTRHRVDGSPRLLRQT
jgi:hypothetical protein